MIPKDNEALKSSNDFERIIITCLNQVSALHKELGGRGKELLPQRNQFGEESTRLDVDSEEVIIENFQRKGVAAKIVSEEHGTFDINGSPQHVVVVDGIDGSFNYLHAMGVAEYGPMIGVLQGADPRYKDFLACGLMLLSPKPIILVGSFRKGDLIYEEGEKRVAHCSNVEKLDQNTRLLIDDSFEEVKRICNKIPGIYYKNLISSAAHYAHLVTGRADLVFECTRKHNLELLAAYGLIILAGGVMMTVDGEDIGQQKYLQFAQEPNIHIPIISAATRELAKNFISSANKV